MTVQVKICGLRDEASVAAAVRAGASFAGFVFYPKSPRFVMPEYAGDLIEMLPFKIQSVGLFVDAADDDITKIMDAAKLAAIQLHGGETPERVAAVKKLTGLPVIKAVGIASQADIALAKSCEDVADMLLLDAKPMGGALPGGNAQVFDWSVARQAGLTKPWMLAGGLTADNVAAAVATSGAAMVDVSSGVEDAPGQKNPAKIRDFIEAVSRIETAC